MISTKYWEEPPGSGNIVGVAVTYRGKREGPEAMRRLLEAAEKTLVPKGRHIDGFPIEIEGSTCNSRSDSPGAADIIIATAGILPDDKRKRRTFYLPSELKSACFLRGRLRK